MKKLFAAALVLVFTTAAYAQNNDLVRLEQLGAYASIQQNAGMNKVVGLDGAGVFTSPANDAAVFTSGKGSDLTVTQSGGAVVRGEQIGANWMGISQDGAQSVVAYQEMTGAAGYRRNHLTVLQQNGDHKAIISQVGYDNDISLQQKVERQNGSLAEITQSGNGNDVTGIDAIANGVRHGLPVGAGGWWGSPAQAGGQFGDHTLKVDQIGNNNTLAVFQAGANMNNGAMGDNSLYLTQKNGSYAEVVQFGDGNNVSGTGAGVTDQAGQDASTLYLLQSGNSNTLSFDQVSAGSIIDLVQTGNQSTAIINQN